MDAAAQHNQEIISSRVGGFGGSDAHLFLSIARKGLAGIGQNNLQRIAIAMGIREPEDHIDNKHTRAGHAFEELMDDTITLMDDEIEREKKLEAGMEFHADNFCIFAHADFWKPSTKKVFELKFSSHATEDVMNDSRYKPQFQWYYMLGAECVELVHGHGEKEPFECKEVTRQIIPKNEELIEELKKGVMILDQAIGEGWQPELKDVDFLEPDIESSIQFMFELKDKIDKLNEEYEKAKERVRKYMEGMEKSKFQVEHEGNIRSCTLSAPTVSRKFDQKLLFKDHPEMDCAKYYKDVKSKGAFKVN